MSGIEKYGWVNAARGYAILLVVLVHVPLFLFDANHFSWIAHSGDMGVQLFFVMSAFTLFNSYAKRSKANTGHVKGAFFIRRLFRIAPYYWLATMVYVVAEIWWFGRKINVTALLSNVLFVNGLCLHGIVYLPPGGWSIGVEMAFYLTIPLLFRYTKSLRAAVIVLVLAIAASNAVNFAEYLFITHYTHRSWIELRGFQLYFWFPNQFPVFCFGIVLYFIHRSVGVSERTGRVLLYASIVAFIALCAVPFSVQYPYYFFQREYIYGLVFLGFCIGLYAGRSRISRIRLVQDIGVTSFSLYLNHFLVLMALRSFNGRLLHWVESQHPDMMPYVKSGLLLTVYYALTVFISYQLSKLTYRYVELNGIRLGERVLQRLGWSRAVGQRSDMREGDARTELVRQVW